MRITAYPSLSEPQFLGCLGAFVDSLFGELNSAAMYLRKLEGRPKGSAFAYEMALDNHRYGALIVLDRWAALLRAFGPHADAPASIADAEDILGRVNQVIDATESYSEEAVAACLMAFQALNTTFAREKDRAGRQSALGPMLPEEYGQARRIFTEDLAAR